MGIKQKPSVFLTTDGKEWADAAGAQSHQSKLDAAQSLRLAQDEFIRAVAESTLTAEGKQFSFDCWTYYHVWVGHGSIPRVTTVYVDRWSIELDTEGCARVCDSRERTNTDPARLQYWLISDLYQDHHAASKACVAKAKEWLNDRKSQVDGMESKVAQGGTL